VTAFNVDAAGHIYELDGLMAEIARIALERHGQRLVTEESDKGPIYRLEEVNIVSNAGWLVDWERSHDERFSRLANPRPGPEQPIGAGIVGETETGITTETDDSMHTPIGAAIVGETDTQDLPGQ
jgi:hypothetical protein